MISQLPCLGNSSPEPALVPEGLGKAQSRQDDIQGDDGRKKGMKKVRIKNQPLIDKPAGPGSLEKDVELSSKQYKFLQNEFSILKKYENM